MRKCLVVLGAAILLLSCKESAPKGDVMVSDFSLRDYTDTINYILGYQQGQNCMGRLMIAEKDLDSSSITTGFISGLKRDTLFMSEAQMDTMMKCFSDALMERLKNKDQ
ncbi:MAG: hypothetical protein J6Q59_06505 [Paludibacteraceae bacterium]|jgi:hypothetical protein|nr:hypothetical protein [Paludibacteraceae bacterium]MBO5863900.1 hypothetical protein [Paludibacteraceae bacterium]MEE0997014.1 FKBP-type peptidyl-prolyl cis-trans isomerase N-terminal domain-containing protein [Paludibacteraceae bacterium]